MKEALILLAIAGYTLAQPAPHGYIGAGGCASSNCHGGTTALPAGESRILGNEYAHWSVSDKHARAYQALTEARGKRMAEVLGMADRLLVVRNGRIVAEFTREAFRPETVFAHAAGLVAQDALPEQLH